MNPLIYEDMCYVLVQTNVIHPIAYERHNFIWYPEREMTLLDAVNYQPYVTSIVTENPWLIGCYDQEHVRIWKDGDWVWPAEQTYGASIDRIMMYMLGVRQTISSFPLDGGDEINKLIKKLELSYK